MSGAWAAGRLRRRAAGLGAALALTLGSAGGAAAAELLAHGPADCPGADELTFRVERAIGVPLSRAAGLRFAVRFERATELYTAQLEVAGDEPEAHAAARRFSAEDCTRLGDAVGLAIALALGASAPSGAEGATHGRQEERAAPASAPPAPVPRDEPGAPQPEQANVAALTPLLAAGLVLDSGSLPAAGLGLSVAAELRLPRLALRLSGLMLLDQRRALGGAQPAAGAELGLSLGSVSLCTLAWRGAGAPLAVFACGGWELGRIEGAGSGVREPRRGSALWTAPRLEAHLSWAPLPGPLRLAAQLGAAAPLKRDDFFLRDIGSVHRPPALVGRAGLGLEIGFE